MSVTSHFSETRPHGRGAGLWLAAQRRRFFPLLGRLPPDLAGVRLGCPPFVDPPRVASALPSCRVPGVPPSAPAEPALAGPAGAALFGPAFFAGVRAWVALLGVALAGVALPGAALPGTDFATPAD